MAEGPLSEEQQLRRRAAIAELMPTTPYLSSLGIVFERYEPDDVTIRLPFRADLTNDGTYYHGGVIAAVMDTTGAAAAWSNHDFDKGARASTVAMSIQYVGACKQSDLRCHAADGPPGQGAHVHRDHRDRRRRRRGRPRGADLPDRVMATASRPRARGAAAPRRARAPAPGDR